MIDHEQKGNLHGQRRGQKEEIHFHASVFFVICKTPLIIILRKLCDIIYVTVL